jgi:choline dehydrogenase-like flavoprotein
MISDAGSLPSGTTIAADLCVVGAGAAGIALVLQLAGSNLRIVVVESGSFKFDQETQSLYDGEVATGSLHSPPNRFRQRMFGGSTTIWGGRSVPFAALDLAVRPWVAHSGWPIDYGELARYYPAATRLLEAGDCVYAADAAVEGGMRPIVRGFEPRSFTTGTIERFSCPTDFGARYGHRLAAHPNIQVLLHANCTEIVTSGAGDTVETLVIRTLCGTQLHVAANLFVLAAGGLEVPRLLLASRRVDPRGIGNDHGLVGRYYMCHLSGQIGDLRFHTPADSVWHGYERAWDGTYCRRRIALKAEVQQRLGIGNIALRLHHRRLPDPSHGSGILSAIYLARPFIGFEYSTRLHGSDVLRPGQYLQHMLNVAREPFATASFLIDWLRRRTLAARKFPSLVVAPRANLYSLDIQCEQQPNPESRIVLTDASDRLGVPRLMVDWRYMPADIRTVAETLKLLQAELAAWGGGRLDYEPTEVEAYMVRDGAYGGHHIGTARMGASRETGVVDANCRVHGVANLYIAGSAVFPTSSEANPTLTIIALALRLADHLGAVAANGSPQSAA